MKAMSQKEISIKTFFSIRNIQELLIKEKGNEHAEFYLKCLVDEEVADSIIFQPLEMAEVFVKGGEELLFAGVIRQLRVIQEGRGYSVDLYSNSSTVLLDEEKKSRTLQNVDRTYAEILREIICGTSRYSMQMYAEAPKIGVPLYQFNETDWEFIKRLASHLGTQAVPYAASGYAGIAIGLPDAAVHRDTAEALCEKVWMDKNTRCICRSLRTYNNWNIGDEVIFGGKEYAVFEKTCRLEKGLLYFRYFIADRNVFETGRYGNPDLSGILLPATVIGRRDERIKLHFDIDRTQSVEEAFWYPWRPDVGNLIYCIPELGEKVYVQFGDDDGKQVRAVYAIHTNGRENPEFVKDDRYFTTQEKKRIYLKADRMGVQDLAQTSPLNIELTDQSGVSAASCSKIVISAKDTIGFKGTRVFIQAPKEISIVRRDTLSPTVINMCNGFDTVGYKTEVTMKDNASEEFPVFSDLKQKETKQCKLGDIEKDLILGTPNLGLNNHMEQQISGMLVSRLPADKKRRRDIDSFPGKA